MSLFIKMFQKISLKQWFVWLFVVILMIGSVIFVHNNYSFYDEPIATITSSTITNTTEITDSFENQDSLVTQEIEAEIRNGAHKGETLFAENSFSPSQVESQQYNNGTDVFISISTQSKNGLIGEIKNVKRDTYLLYIGWLFVIALLLVGKKQGLLSLISLSINIVILSVAIDFYISSSKEILLWICAVCILLFTFISLLLVNGFNQKTFVAIIATILGTFISIGITVLALNLTNENGLRYEEIQFITRPYKIVFLAGVFIGSLGAVMDIAITMSSSLFGLFEENPKISMRDLIQSGNEIGKDIMGTMTNILFFAYVSGSIPMLIIYFKNAATLGYALSFNLSLELVRALAGGIGIVITIPIGLYTAIFLIKRKQEKL